MTGYKDIVVFGACAYIVSVELKLEGFFRKIALRKEPANLLLFAVAFVRLYEDHSSERHYVAICKG